MFKRNLRHDKHIGGKHQFKYLGLYSIVSCCANGNLRLKGHFSHFLKKSIPPRHLVQFYEDKLYKVNKKGQFDSGEEMFPNSAQEDMSFVPDSTQEDISSDQNSKQDDIFL